MQSKTKNSIERKKIFFCIQNLNEMHFQFQEKERPDDFVSNLAGRMRVIISIRKFIQKSFFFIQNYPLTECLSGDYEMREFRPDLINEELNDYLIPSKMR